MSADRFWLVWSPAGRTPPKYRHETKAKAQIEAERLARVNPGQSFYVVEAVSCSSVPMMVTTVPMGIRFDGGFQRAYSDECVKAGMIGVLPEIAGADFGVRPAMVTPRTPDDVLRDTAGALLASAKRIVRWWDCGEPRSDSLSDIIGGFRRAIARAEARP